ncbi:phage tail length tape measure family protein [Tardiphaga sp. 20_F10_N6_6]|uniref:phage tail length tape measure family protein n=1 Tax=Tardiphaga sp. 20_F10_N6_6 TaxID=3240788 RepID=UPI003F89F586
MTVALSSLRVTSDFDAAGYVRGAAQKVAADQQMIAADKARNASLAQVDAAVAKVVPGMSKLSASLLDGYSAGSKFDLTIRQIGNAVDRGMGLDRANVLLDAAYKKFGLTADAIALAERGFVSIAPAVDQANSRLEAQARFAADLESAVKRLTAVQQVQIRIESQFGIGASANDNSASRAADIEALGVSLNNLRAKYAPLYAAQQQYLTTLKDLNSIEARTALTETERAAALQRTKDAFASQVVAIRNAGNQTDQLGKSGSSAAQKLGQLSYQVNDIMGGLVSGQSPLTILAQQGTQVSQIFTSGARTVGGALAAIGGVTVVAGVIAAAQAIGNLRKEMGDLGDTARRTNTSSGDLQLILAAGRYKGLSADDGANAAQGLAAGLNQALKYSTDLSQLFASNGVSLRTQAGNAKGLTDILAQGADLVRNARTEQDKFLIVQQLGLSPTREMVKYLEQGGAALKLAMEDARLAGGVIDDKLIRSAAQFDERWSVASTNISLKFRSWIAESLDGFGRLSDSPLFSKLLTIGTFLPLVGPLIGLGRTVANIGAPGAAANDPQRRLEGSFSLVTAENDRVASGNRTKLTADTAKLLGIESQRIGLLGVTATTSQQVRAAEIALDQAHLAGVDISEKQRAAVLALAREQALGITVLKQQTDATRIQTETIGMSVGAAAEFTAVQTRLAEALRNKQSLTAQDIEQIRAQAAALGDATMAAERKRIADQVSFGGRTSLLSAEDVQIATQLRGLYPDVATALASVEASGLRTNTALSGLANSMSGTLNTGIADVLDSTKSLGAGAGDMSRAFVRALNEMLVKMLIVAPIMRSMQGLFGGGGLPLPGASDFMGPVANANGNAFSGSNVIPFRSGGAFTNQVFSAPTFFQFRNGGAMANGVMAEAGEEAVMPLRRGSDGRLGVSMVGGQAGGPSTSAGDVSITVNVNVPEGTGTDDAGAIAEAVKAAIVPVIDERLSYHSRSRGMLNNAS